MKPELNNKPLIPYGWLRALIFVLLYLAVLVAAGVVLVFFQNKSIIAADKTDVSGGAFYLSAIVNAAISVALVWLFRKLVDRRSFESMGFAIDKNGSHAGTGFFLGIFLLCAGTCILFFTKNLVWTDISFNGNDLFISFGLMLIVAFYEEIVFRGYILNNLLTSFSKWPALVIAAFIFALAHLANPNFSVLAAINILLAGILLGLNYIYTRNLWFSIMLHFTWNFLQGPVLGYDVSGMHLQSLLQHEVSGNTLLTGGKFGFEGSLIATLLQLGAIGILVWVYEKKYRSGAVQRTVTATT
ncbi:MAG: CPBP family intramembrane glutamic endopeptidase [Chitinophagaceae bacterium]